ncbi:hypothetical protein INT47_011673 [Mucor saturninus]|uniref:Uncharacterized protein n=1 Tax=Mucor saturninus TaxID=64648 RepID=A0A8H7QJ66_9FUNG|nr:hypothetical protein INT47_011673 [Mucor saturninus]
MVPQFQQGNSEDVWNYSSDDLWRSNSVAQHINVDVSDERTPLLSRIIIPTAARVSQWTESFYKRACILNILPVMLVLIWCSVPIPFDDCETILCDYSDYIFPSRNQVRNGSPTRINFWYFLFWYYGLYNALALFLITKLFSIYALNWYPKRLGAKVTFALFWLVSQSIGVVFYYIPMVHNQSIFWVCLTFLTMAMPLVNALLIIHRKRMDRRHRGAIGVLLADENNVPTADPKPSIRWIPTELPKLRAPASYRRFLWFCTALAVALVALIGGEMYAYFFLATLPHTPLEAFFYVYSWVAAIYIMDAITDYILYRKIRSHPLASIFKLYFFMIYFIFYRNLFARLRSVDQFAIVQLASFLWVCIYYPIAMTTQVHGFLVKFIGVRLTYKEYREKIGRSFYLRNLAENTTMLGFLCWVNILHFGPNRAAYPYFHMDDQDGSPYNHNLTVIAALVIWTSELTSAFITRLTFKRAFDFSITQQAISEFERYPEMIIGFVLVMVHVLQNILLALIKLDFSTGLEK